MAHHAADLPPVLPVRCRVALRKFISVLYVVTNIWFGVYGKSVATSKNVFTCPQFVKKTEATEQSRSVFIS